ncbi:MAG: hypothetical protein CMJ49_13135, partial [Planctomycetaceae bacterium]|nr:hypothetical protein [Planctomycetaceae bacterium]
VGFGDLGSTFNESVTFDNPNSALPILIFTSSGSVQWGDAATDLVTLDATNGGQPTMRVRLLTDSAVDANNDMTFTSRVTGAQDLDLIAQDATALFTFQNEVGDSAVPLTPIGDGVGPAIQMGGAGMYDFEHVVETGSGILQDATVGLTTFQRNVTIAAGDTDTTFNSHVAFDNIDSTLATPLLFTAAGNVTFGVDGTDTVTLAAQDGVATQRDVVIRTLLSTGTTVNTDYGMNIIFNSTIDSLQGGGELAQRLIVNSGSGFTSFLGEIGGGGTVDGIAGTPALFSLHTEVDEATFTPLVPAGAEGVTNLGADIFAEGGTIVFNDPVVLVANITVTDTGATGAFFNDTVDGPFNLTLNVDAVTDFLEPVGSITPLGDTTGPAIVINSIGTTDFQDTVVTADGIVQSVGAGLVTFEDNVTIGFVSSGSTFNENVAFDNDDSLAPSLLFTSAGPVQWGDAGTDTVTLMGTFANLPVTLQTTGAGAVGNMTFTSQVTGAQNLLLDPQDPGANFAFEAEVGDSGAGLTPIGNGAANGIAALQLIGAGTYDFQNILETADGILQLDTAGLVTFQNNVTVGFVDTGSIFNASVLFDNPVSALAALTFTSAGPLQFGNAATDLVTLDATNTLPGPPVTSLVVTIETSGVGATGDADFTSRVTGAQDLILNPLDAGATFTFENEVGDSTVPLVPIGDGIGIAIDLQGLGSYDFQSTVETASGINQVGTAGLATFQDDVTIAMGDTDTTFDANVRFDNVASGNARLLFTSAGNMTFGDVPGADTVTLSATGAPTRMDVVIRTAVSTGTDVTLDTGKFITFNAAIDSLQGAGELDQRLIVNSGSGITSFLAEIGGGGTVDAIAGTPALHSLFTEADPVSFAPLDGTDVDLLGPFGATNIGADIFTQGSTQVYNDPVLLVADVFLTDLGAGTDNKGIFFNSTVDSDAPGTPRDLTVMVSLTSVDGVPAGVPVIVFEGDVGSTNPLDQLALNTEDINANDILDAGEDYNTAGLDNGHVTPPNVATIVFNPTGPAGTTTVTVLTTLNIGQNEKTTAPNGGLTFISGGTARFGDASVNGDFTVTSPLIQINTRDMATVRGTTAAGTGILLTETVGVDIIVVGDTPFSTPPVALGTGLDPLFANPLADGDTLFTIAAAGFPYSEFGPIDPVQFKGDGALLDGGVTLDLAFEGQPTNTNVSEIIAGILPMEARMTEVQPGVRIEPALREQLALFINVRGLTADEVLGFLIGRSLYNDLPDEENPLPTDHTVTADRFVREIVSDTVVLFRDLFFEPVLDESGEETFDDEGRPLMRSRTPQILAALQAAFDDYTNQSGGGFDGVAFRAFVDGGSGHGEASEYLARLNELFVNLELLGLAPLEVGIAQTALVKDITPQGMTEEQLKSAINAPITADATP